MMRKPTRAYRLIGSTVVVLFLLAALPSQGAAEGMGEKVNKAIRMFKKEDPGIVKFFSGSYGYVVFPSVAKGGAGLGGAHGKGLVFERGRMVGEASLTQFTIGIQLGGQTYSEVVFFETADAMSSFKDSKFAIGAQISAVAAAEGAAAHAKYSLGVAVFTLAKSGLMCEASVGGQKFKFTPQ